MTFKMTQEAFKKEELWKALKARQKELITDHFGHYFHYDTLSLCKNMSGSELKKFYKEWFKQKADTACGTVELAVNRKHKAVYTNGRLKDKIIIELLREGYLVMNRDGGKNKTNKETGRKKSRTSTSYLHWTGKE